MKKSFVVLTFYLGAAVLAGTLTGCVVAPAQPVYGYGYDYYQPGYPYYPAYPVYAEPSVGIGIGFGGGGGWHGHHHWHGGGGGWHGHGGWRDGH
jgi:hypothetical protein